VGHASAGTGANRKSPNDTLWYAESKTFCKPLILVRVPAEYLQTPDTGQGACGVQSTCKPLTLVRVPAEYLQTPDTGQGACGVQNTCKPLTLARVPAEYLQTPDTVQETKEKSSSCL